MNDFNRLFLAIITQSIEGRPLSLDAFNDIARKEISIPAEKMELYLMLLQDIGVVQNSTPELHPISSTAELLKRSMSVS
jgi:hypothetical protein